MLKLLVIGAALAGVMPACASESACFQTAAEAVVGTGVHDETGFYRVLVRRDRLTGEHWTAVARCGRPELPVSLVRGGEASTLPNPGQAGVVHVRMNRLRERALLETGALQDGPRHIEAGQGRPVVLAGQPVRVTWEVGSARGEMTGTAMDNGATGQSVKVRMAGLMAGTQERLVSGTVQADGTLLLETGR